MTFKDPKDDTYMGARKLRTELRCENGADLQNLAGVTEGREESPKYFGEQRQMGQGGLGKVPHSMMTVNGHPHLYPANMPILRSSGGTPVKAIPDAGGPEFIT